MSEVKAISRALCLLFDFTRPTDRLTNRLLDCFSLPHTVGSDVQRAYMQKSERQGEAK
jgi:hypothetical protein